MNCIESEGNKWAISVGRMALVLRMFTDVNNMIISTKGPNFCSLDLMFFLQDRHA